jgi:hypothetical protein
MDAERTGMPCDMKCCKTVFTEWSSTWGSWNTRHVSHLLFTHL